MNNKKNVNIVILIVSFRADSSRDAPFTGGLTNFGKLVVSEMNRLGMMVDVMHTSNDTIKAVLDVTAAPVIISHASGQGDENKEAKRIDNVVRFLIVSTRLKFKL